MKREREPMTPELTDACAKILLALMAIPLGLRLDALAIVCRLWWDERLSELPGWNEP